MRMQTGALFLNVKKVTNMKLGADYDGNFRVRRRNFNELERDMFTLHE